MNTPAPDDAPRTVEDAVESIVRLAVSREPRCGPTLVVAIDGRSGSGKTTLARPLIARLQAPVIRMDDLYPGWDGLAEGVRRLTEEILEPLSRGATATFSVWDWYAGQWGSRITLPPPDVLVVEGCGSSARGARGYAAVRVWLDAPGAVRRSRALARPDGATFASQWHGWADQEDSLFDADDTRANADLVIELR